MVVIAMSDFDVIVDNFFKNYHDRGMKKWMGFYLSDHTQKIEKTDLQEHTIEEQRPEEPLEEISAKLLEAFGTHYPVNVQFRELDFNGNFKPSLTGFVAGYQNAEVQIEDQLINLEEIKSIEIIRPHE